MRLPLKSPTTAAWLYGAALVIVIVLCVGGATRLTQSGLSITSWNPISGVIPPGNDQAWQAEFANYRKIPQFAQINPHMGLDQFKAIYWWEWLHRMLARLLVLVYFGGLAFLLWAREVPQRVIWRCGVLLGLGLVQGLVGWLMVASGLKGRLFVAPEMLTLHLGVALTLLMFTIWTGAEAQEGAPRVRGAPFGWRLASSLILALVVLQCLLGALVAGNQAGLVYNDWPLMNGQFLPALGSEGDLIHDQAFVQFIHRINAYVLFVFVWLFAVIFGTRCQEDSLRNHAILLAVLVTVQAGLGVATLVSIVNFWFALLHQLMASTLVIVATAFVWRVARAERVLRKSGF
ncbi:MAG: COX15/CtaA family protein [Asticcacaulis sp.]